MRSKSPPVLMLVLVLGAVMVSSGCYQIHHTTHVREGVRVEAAGGVAHVTPRPATAPNVEPSPRVGIDGLLGVGVGKRLGRSAVLFHGTVPLSIFYYDAVPEQRWMLPSFTFFVQSDTADEHISYGAGTILGLRPAAYAQVGFRPAPRASRGVSFDLGARVDTASAAAAYGVVTASAGRFEVGAWADSTLYYGDIAPGDSPTDADYSRMRFSAGLLVRALE